jgi:hypothetical protein
LSYHDPRLFASSVLNLFRVFLRCLCAVCSVPALVHAQTNGETPHASSLPPELAALLAAQPRWTVLTHAESAFGYKDNLLLSASGEERSAFARGEVAMYLMRHPRGALEFSLLGQAEGTRYFGSETVDDEGQVWMETELGYRLTDTLKFSVPLTGYYYDQVFDVSDTDIERVVAEFKVGGLIAGPTVRWTYHRRGWVEVQGVGERKRYEDGANDSRIGEAVVRLGWKFGNRIEAKVRGTRRRRDFDERLHYTAAGRALPGTKLKLDEREGELRFDVEWDAERTWRSVTRFATVRRRDDFSNYFGYEQKKVSHEIAWKRDPWLVRIGGSAERLEFAVQTVGIRIDPPPRIQEGFNGDLRIERKLGARWTLFTGYSWERSRSNEPLASYVVNEGLLGARWSWEK